MRFVRIAVLLGSFCFLAFSQVADDSGGTTVTPEPSMIGLVAAGLAGVGVVAWRRNRKKK